MLSLSIRAFIRVYQLFFSPFLHLISGGGGGCRFEVTCSRYAEQAFEHYRFSQALKLTLRRFLNCHPWGQWGPKTIQENVVENKGNRNGP